MDAAAERAIETAASDSLGGALTAFDKLSPDLRQLAMQRYHERLAVERPAGGHMQRVEE